MTHYRCFKALGRSNLPVQILLSAVQRMTGSFADVDEASKREIKDILMGYDRSLLVADPRRPEPKLQRIRARHLRADSNQLALGCIDAVFGHRSIIFQHFLIFRVVHRFKKGETF